MEIRPYKSDDYDKIKGWWESYGWPPVQPHMLSSTGMVVEDLCAGWLYQTDSSIALLEWVVGNPAADKEERGKAIDFLIETATKLAKLNGFKLMFTFTNSKKLINRMNENHSFIITDTNMTNLVRGL